MHQTWTYLAQGGFGAKCKCKQHSGIFTHQWQAEDWARDHMTEVERIQARHANRSPSLSTSLRLFREAQANTDCTPEQQAIFERMADEIESRINTSGDEQLPLW